MLVVVVEKEEEEEEAVVSECTLVFVLISAAGVHDMKQ
jgi:hypothetical protein